MKLTSTILAAGVLAAGTATAGDYSTWGNYRNITVNTVGITNAVLTNYPVLVRFNATTHANMFVAPANAMPNGADIRITKADGTTDLPFEVEHWVNGANGSGAIWVRLDSVLANSATAASFRVYWRKPGSTTMSNPAATFPTANGFQAVFHLSEPTGNVTDAANGYVGTATGTSSLDGQIGLARSFHGSQPGATTPAESWIMFNPGASATLSTHTGPITMEAWVLSSPVTNNGNTSAGTKQIISRTNASGDGAFMFRSGTGAPGNYYGAGGTAAGADSVGPRVPFGEAANWAYITAVYNGTQWTIRRQRNDDPWGVPTITGGETTPVVSFTAPGPVASANPWFIGAWSSNGTATGTMERPWAGELDEIRVSTVARDSNYIRLNYETQRTTSTAVVVGPNVTVSLMPGTQTVASRLWTQRQGDALVFLIPDNFSGRLSVVDLRGKEVWSRDVAAGTASVSWKPAGEASRAVHVARLIPAGQTAPAAAARVMPLR